jgi:SAM-dependent methyltransferase
VKKLVFGRGYSHQYDAIYGEKDYEAEVVMIEEAFRLYGNGKVQTVLDLGCGTGNHAIPLACRGYQVTGMDRSADMLARARRKTRSVKLPSSVNPPKYLRGDVRNFDLAKRFDVVLMMFAVLGYQITNDDVLASLQRVRSHLKPGGLFIFDVWYGPAVLSIRPGERVKVIKAKDREIVRVASGSLDIVRHLAEVRYRVWDMAGGRVLSETEEIHRMRYFFPQELAFFLAQAEMEMVGFHKYGDLSTTPDEGSWNILVISR